MIIIAEVIKENSDEFEISVVEVDAPFVITKVKDKLYIIPRIYTNKPRTTGKGYKGMLHQPDPEKKPDFRQGLIAMRKLHIRAMESSGLTSADEMLYPENWGYGRS